MVASGMLDETGTPADLVLFPIRLAIFVGAGVLLSVAIVLLVVAAGALLLYVFDPERAWRAEGYWGGRTLLVAGLLAAAALTVVLLWRAGTGAAQDWRWSSGHECCLGDGATPGPWDAPTPIGGYP
jgi:hypothetical protein